MMNEFNINQNMIRVWKDEDEFVYHTKLGGYMNSSSDMNELGEIASGGLLER